MKRNLFHIGETLAMVFLAAAAATAANPKRDILVLTSTNDPNQNQIAVFELNATAGTASLPLVANLPTGGKGGASGNAGAVQFGDVFGAVVNYGSNNLTQLVRAGNSIRTAGTIELASSCTAPDSVALTKDHAFVVGANCAESHAWPSGHVDGGIIPLSDSSSAQIVAGQTWAAVTLKSGSVLQLLLSEDGALNGTSSTITLPSDANNTPFGAAFWGDVLAFNPAHSPDSFALVDKNQDVVPVLGPQPAYPGNAPCWLAKGPGSVWYSGNSPGQAISIFFSDGQGGTFYKSIPLPGVPTDITVSRDNKWLAVIYTAADNTGARVAVFAVDSYGDLTLAATSNPIGVASFNGVAISE